MGEVKSEILKEKGIKDRVFYADLDWEILSKAALTQKIKFAEVSKFPSVSRDISMIVPENLSFASIKEAILQCNPKLIKEAGITDVYKGDKIEAGKKSYLVNLIIQDADKTLTDEACDKLMGKVFGVLEEKLGAVVRK